MKKYTIGRGPKKPHNTSKKPNKSSKEAKRIRKAELGKSRAIVQRVLRNNKGNSTMRFNNNFTDLIKYMKANEGAHNHHGFYENKIPGKSWLLSPIEQQDRPAFFVDDELVSDIKAQSSIHKHFLDESDRHDAIKDVISKKTGKSLPHVLDSISKFGANPDVNIKRTHFSPTKIPIQFVSATPDMGSRRGGKKNKKNKTRRK